MRPEPTFDRRVCKNAPDSSPATALNSSSAYATVVPPYGAEPVASCPIVTHPVAGESQHKDPPPVPPPASMRAVPPTKEPTPANASAAAP